MPTQSPQMTLQTSKLKLLKLTIIFALFFIILLCSKLSYVKRICSRYKTKSINFYCTLQCKYNLQLLMFIKKDKVKNIKNVKINIFVFTTKYTKCLEQIKKIINQRWYILQSDNKLSAFQDSFRRAFINCKTKAFIYFMYIFRENYTKAVNGTYLLKRL